MVYITAIHLSGGTRSQHISDVRWLDPADGKTGESSRAGMVSYIDEKNGTVRVGSPAGPIEVETVHPSDGAAYIRTVANRQETDNLLSLAQY